MMNLFKLFLKPVDVSALDDMRLSDIMKLTGRLQDGNNIIVLAKDKGHRVSQLQHIIADRIKLLIGWSGQADVSALTIEFHDDTIIVSDEKFNKLAHEYAAEHKLYCDATSWTTWGGFYNAIDEAVQYSYNFTSESQKGTLVDMAKVITDCMVKAHRSFDSLRQVARKFDWAVPVVEYIRVYASGKDVYGAPVWHISNFSITPENLNGFLAAAKGILQDDKVIAEWRKEIISNFRIASYGNNVEVDYNVPSVMVITPDEWKKTYYETIKPAAERRERCKAVIEEIKGHMTRDDILRSIGIAEAVEKYRHLISTCCGEESPK